VKISHPAMLIQQTKKEFKSKNLLKFFRKFLMKPVVRDQIAKTIRKVLDEGKEK